jgi:DNA-directed RNA polymerase subunit RPC12/RpoP
MAISHLCITCGADLARVRARREEHYGLPLVLCPRCGTAAVRRQRPLGRWWATRRLGISLAALLAQLALLTGFIWLTIFVCIELGREIALGRLGIDQPEKTIILALAFGLLPIALGTWLTAGLRHWRGAAAWITFALLILPMLSIDTLILPWLAILVNDAAFAAEVGPCRWDLWLGRLIALAAIMGVALLGIPVGMGLAFAHDRLRRGLRRAHRRHLRAQRVTA